MSADSLHSTCSQVHPDSALPSAPVAAAVKTWQERMPAPRTVMRCTMNCSPSNPPCGDCLPERVFGDAVAARDAEIAELRAAMIAQARAAAPSTTLIDSHINHTANVLHGRAAAPAATEEIWKAEIARLKHELVVAKRGNEMLLSENDRLSQQPVQAAAMPVELEGVDVQLKKDAGFWESCSGCYETEDGHPVGRYAYSSVFKCPLGSGCSECGGLGAVWDSTDYAAMHEEFGSDDAAPTATAEPTTIDTPEFRKLLLAWANEESDFSVAGFGTLIAHIDAKLAAPAPQQAAPLTDARIGDLYLSVRHIGHATNRELAFARAIERELSAGSAASAGDARLKDLEEALTYYAEGHHLIFADPDAWDTVSGEPMNFLCDEAGTATVEDGSIAKLALAGNPLAWDEERKVSDDRAAMAATKEKKQ